MAESRIFATLAVPAAAPQPSIHCVQWSEDGQLVLTTKSAIYILTPDLGINYDDLSSSKTATDKRNGRDNKDHELSLSMYRNLIEFDRSTQHHWVTESQEWGALSLGSLDVSWRSVTLSPSNLTSNSGCFLVAMNTNMEVTLWCATKNHLREAWIRVQDVTAALREFPLAENEEDTTIPQPYLRTLQAQIDCISWSPQADFGLSPNPLVDGSLLALGTRTGSVIMMRSDGNKSVQPIKIIRIADEWVTHLAWGPWKTLSAGECEAWLACGCSDGSIVLVTVVQKFVQQISVSPSTPNMSIQANLSVSDFRASESDGIGITALKWIDASHNMPMLLHAKPGVLKFFLMDNSSPPQGKELCQLRLTTQKTSVCSSSLTPVVGVSQIHGLDALIVTLFDGTFHVVQDVSTLPRFDGDLMDLDDESMKPPTSENLSRSARAAFRKAEDQSIQFADVNRTGGATSLDNLGTMIWLHQSCRPTDFSFKQDSQYNSVLVATTLLSHPRLHETILSLIRSSLASPQSKISQAPIHVLRPVFAHLSQRKLFDEIWEDVNKVIASPTAEIEDEEPNALTITPPSIVDEQSRRDFRRSLHVDLYGWESFNACRLRLATADFCWKMSPDKTVQKIFGDSARASLTSISHRFLKIIVKHLMTTIDVMSDEDVPFVMRVLVQSILPGSPDSLRDSGNELHQAVKLKFPASSDISRLNEPCPACSQPIELEDLYTAKCEQGHVWARCTITSFILSTPMVRTCIGCTRKAFLPPSLRGSDNADLMWIPDAGQSWIVEELLEAASCCIYCGNRFVRVL